MIDELREAVAALESLLALVQGEAPSLLRDDHHYDMAVRAIEAGNKALIEQDNAVGALAWVRDRLYPYVLREAGPKGQVPVERMAELVARALDRAAQREKYLVSVAPPLCPSCGSIREHMPCNSDGAITGCWDSFHLKG